MKPSVGRIVHYVSYGTPIQPDGSQAYESKCRAAIIAEVIDPVADLGGGPLPPETLENLPNDPVVLCVLNPTGLFFHDAEYDENHAGGSWHWCERVE